MSDTMKKIFKWLMLGMIAIIVLLVGTYYLVRYQAVNVIPSNITTKTEYGWFVDAEDDTEIGSIIFYQGAFVDAKAYVPLSESIASLGYNVYLLDGMFDFPILSLNLTNRVIEKEKIKQPILMGHSLGGVVAGMVSEKISEKGLILLASYPSETVDLSDESIHVLSFTASEDNILNVERWQEAKQRLPKATIYVEIVGGNHSQFGQYGKQKGDGQATITTEQQINEIVKAIENNFMKGE